MDLNIETTLTVGVSTVRISIDTEVEANTITDGTGKVVRQNISLDVEKLATDVGRHAVMLVRGMP